MMEYEQFKNEIVKFEDKWVKLEKIIRIVVIQFQKDKQGIYSFISEY